MDRPRSLPGDSARALRRGRTPSSRRRHHHALGREGQFCTDVKGTGDADALEIACEAESASALSVDTECAVRYARNCFSSRAPPTKDGPPPDPRTTCSPRRTRTRCVATRCPRCTPVSPSTSARRPTGGAIASRRCAGARDARVRLGPPHLSRVSSTPGSPRVGFPAGSALLCLLRGRALGMQ